MDAVNFVVPGKPQGKARARTFYNPRTKGMSSMTPEKTVLYENLIATCFMQTAGQERFPDDAYLSATVIACYEPAKSTSQKKRQEMLSGQIRPDKKPDIDNIAKSVLDALNGVAYRDDTQVVELHARKLYSSQPCVMVRIEKI